MSGAASRAEMLTHSRTRWSILPLSVTPNPSLLNTLAYSFLAGELAVDLIVDRASRTLGRRWRWLQPVARRYVIAMMGRTRPRHRDVVRFLLDDPDFQRACAERRIRSSVKHWLLEPQHMFPAEAAKTWDVIVLESVKDLANWLSVHLSELEWFADLKGLGYKKSSPQLRHYHYRVLAKPSGSIRLIESPKPRLKELQRQILTEILDKIPSHPAVHGFVKGRSIQTFVAPHVGQRVVLRMDLQDFFPSFAAARIQTFFRTVGYPESVADLLGGLCTNAVPRNIWNAHAQQAEPSALQDARILYAQPHLPQGAPTSPALANLCTYRVDCRLAGLAKSVGAEYTRYADDLAFSGGEEFEQCVERFSFYAAAVLMEEGFTVHHRKTRIMRQGVRQYLAGLVTNQHINVIRTDFDRLKAILTNCARLGPESQNRDAHSNFRAHLEGRIGFFAMVNPAKGQRLRAIFNQIQWPS